MWHCCRPRPRYKRLIDGLFPKKTADPINGGMLLKLQNYAATNPEKLPSIGRVLEKRASHFARKRKFPFVEMVLKAFYEVAHATADSVPLFAHHLVATIGLAFRNRQNLSAQIAAADCLSQVCGFLVDTPVLKELDSFVPELLALTKTETSDTELNIRARAAALRALGRVAQVLELQVMRHVAAITEAVVLNVMFASRQEPQAPTPSSASLHAPGAPQSRPSLEATALECIHQIARLVSASSLKEFTAILFRIFQEHNIWVLLPGPTAAEAATSPGTATATAPVRDLVILEIMQGLKTQFGYPFVMYVVDQAGLLFRTSFRAAAVAALDAAVILIGKCRSPGGPRLLEMVARLIALQLDSRMSMRSSSPRDGAGETAPPGPIDKYAARVWSALASKPSNHSHTFEILTVILSHIPTTLLPLSAFYVDDGSPSRILRILQTAITVAESAPGLSTGRGFPDAVLKPILAVICQAPDDECLAGIQLLRICLYQQSHAQQQQQQQQQLQSHAQRRSVMHDKLDGSSVGGAGGGSVVSGSSLSPVSIGGGSGSTLRSLHVLSRVQIQQIHEAVFLAFGFRTRHASLPAASPPLPAKAMLLLLRRSAETYLSLYRLLCVLLRDLRVRCLEFAIPLVFRLQDSMAYSYSAAGELSVPSLELAATADAAGDGLRSEHAEHSADTGGRFPSSSSAHSPSSPSSSSLVVLNDRTSPAAAAAAAAASAGTSTGGPSLKYFYYDWGSSLSRDYSTGERLIVLSLVLGYCILMSGVFKISPLRKYLMELLEKRRRSVGGPSLEGASLFPSCLSFFDDTIDLYPGDAVTAGGATPFSARSPVALDVSDVSLSLQQQQQQQHRREEEGEEGEDVAANGGDGSVGLHAIPAAWVDVLVNREFLVTNVLRIENAGQVLDRELLMRPYEVLSLAHSISVSADGVAAGTGAGAGAMDGGKTGLAAGAGGEELYLNDGGTSSMILHAAGEADGGAGAGGEFGEEVEDEQSVSPSETAATEEGGEDEAGLGLGLGLGLGFYPGLHVRSRSSVSSSSTSGHEESSSAVVVTLPTSVSAGGGALSGAVAGTSPLLLPSMSRILRSSANRHALYHAEVLEKILLPIYAAVPSPLGPLVFPSEDTFDIPPLV